jgi:hypothetical protein
MAHHLASLILAAENEATAEKQIAARTKVEQLILQLWQQRANLPGNADPMTRYQSALTTLELMSPNAMPWRRNSAVKLHALAAELYENVNNLTYGVILSEVGPEMPRTEYEDLAYSFLSDTEQRIQQLLRSLSIKTVLYGADSSKTIELASIDERVRLSIEALVVKTAKILEQLATELSQKSISPENTDEP